MRAGAAHPALVMGERVLQLRHQPGGVIELGTDKGIHLTRAALVACGVGAFEPTRLQAEGVERFEGNGVYYFVKERCVFAGKRLLVVGGGDSAVDWALNLQDVADHITLVHRRNEFRAHESSVTQLLGSPAHKLHILTPHEIGRIEGDRRIERAVVINNETHVEAALLVGAVLLNLGFKADIGPIRAWGLELERRTVKANARCETNLPEVAATPTGRISMRSIPASPPSY